MTTTNSTDTPVDLLEALAQSIGTSVDDAVANYRAQQYAESFEGVSYNALQTMASAERASGRTYAWSRPADVACERGTLGCSIRHTHDELNSCEPWGQ